MNRSTIILVSVLLLLAAITYFLLPSDEERRASYKSPELTLSVDSANVVKIEIQRPSKSITIENVGGKWTITSPAHYPADPTAVTQLVSSFMHFRRGSLISSNPEKQSLFQVDAGGSKLILTERSGKSSVIIIGKTGPSFAEVYFRLPESNDVYLGQGIDSWTVNKEIKDWRDKAILSAPSESIRRLIYTSSNRIRDFQRDSGGWRSADQQIDVTTMRPVLNALSGLRADDFIDTAVQFKATPVLVQVSGGEDATLTLRPATPDSSRYAVQSSKGPQVYLIPKWTAQQILQPMEKTPGTISPQPVAVKPPAKTITPATTPKVSPAVTKEAVKPPPSATPKKETKTQDVIKSPKVTKTEPATKPAPVVTEPVKTSSKEPAAFNPFRQKRKTDTSPQQNVSSPEKTVAPPVSTPPKSGATKTGQSPAKSTPPSSASDEEGDLTIHTVKKNETMTTIAKTYNVSVEEILRWNLLKSIGVQPGQELYIYRKKK